MTNSHNQEIERLQTELKQLQERYDAIRDVLTAAQRLNDQIHLAGVTTVRITHPVIENTRRPEQITTTVVGHTADLLAAIENMNAALKHLWQS